MGQRTGELGVDLGTLSFEPAELNALLHDNAPDEEAAPELELLLPESAVVEMLEDHGVMREQARACRSER